MTIIEAEEIYCKKVEEYKEDFKNKCKNAVKFFFIIACVLFISSAILLIVGHSMPKETDYFGREEDSSAAIIEKVLGCWVLAMGILFIILSFFIYRSSKKGPNNYLCLNKELWLNYIRCEDVAQDDKEYYKQKLEDIRAAEIAGSINRASTAVILGSLIK